MLTSTLTTPQPSSVACQWIQYSALNNPHDVARAPIGTSWCRKKKTKHKEKAKKLKDNYLQLKVICWFLVNDPQLAIRHLFALKVVVKEDLSA